MNINTIRQDIKEAGYALVDHLLTSEQLESIRIVSFRSLHLDTKKICNYSRKFSISMIKNLTILFQECETLREVAATARPSSPHWGASNVASCIYETLPGNLCTSNPSLRRSYSIYRSTRSTWPLQSAVWSILFNSQLTDLVTALLGPKAVLFNDQYIVKPSHGGEAASFAWHRDSDWCREGSLPQPYISIWVALDDCEVENGCLFIRPQSHVACSNYAHIPGLEPKLETSISPDDINDNLDNCNVVQGTKLLLENQNAATTKEVPSLSKVKEVPLLISAGSAVIMTDVVEHASGANRTQYARRGWMPQFSCQPIVWKETESPVSLAVPLKKPK